jgi:prephenate dehydrogenase
VHTLAIDVIQNRSDTSAMDRFTRHPLPDTLRIAIVGLGLLGGSVAQGLRASGFSGRIAGHDLQDATLQAALSAGVIDEGAGDPRQLFMDFDLVVLCQPVDALLQFLARHRDGLAAGSATVLDVASVKAPVAAAIAGTPAEQRMVPCHPIAGRERSGWPAATAELFHGRLCVLTPADGIAPHRLALAETLWSALGARTTRMAAEQHDRMLSATSHLPQLLSYAFLHSLAARGGAEHWLPYCGTGFRSFTRLGGSDPALWSDIALHNAPAILQEIDHFSASLALLRSSLAQGRSADLTEAFAQARSFHDRVGLQQPATAA